MPVENEFVRPARPDDAPHVQRLLSAEGLDTEFLAREFVVVEADGRIVACARAKRVPEGGTELSSLVVQASHRGRGLSRAMFEMSLLGARHPVYALTLVPDLAKKAGFEPVAHPELPPSLKAKAAACDMKGRAWTPMRLRRKPVQLLELEPQGEPGFLEV